MTLEIIIAVIAVTFILLVVFLVITLQRLRKVLQNVDELVMDVKKKSEGLDVLFHPLYELKKEKSAGHKGCDKVCELLMYIVEGVQIYHKLKK